MDNARLVETCKSQLIYSCILNREANYKVSQKYLAIANFKDHKTGYKMLKSHTFEMDVLAERARVVERNFPAQLRIQNAHDRNPKRR